MVYDNKLSISALGAILILIANNFYRANSRRHYRRPNRSAQINAVMPFSFVAILCKTGGSVTLRQSIATLHRRNKNLSLRWKSDHIYIATQFSVNRFYFSGYLPLSCRDILKMPFINIFFIFGNFDQ